MGKLFLGSCFCLFLVWTPIEEFNWVSVRTWKWRKRPNPTSLLSFHFKSAFKSSTFCSLGGGLLSESTFSATFPTRPNTPVHTHCTPLQHTMTREHDWLEIRTRWNETNKRVVCSSNCARLRVVSGSRRSCSRGSWLWLRPSSRLVSDRWGPAGRRTPTTRRWRCNGSQSPEYLPVNTEEEEGER